jgi:hypothetical protein
VLPTKQRKVNEAFSMRRSAIRLDRFVKRSLPRPYIWEYILLRVRLTRSLGSIDVKITIGEGHQRSGLFGGGGKIWWELG